MRLPGQIRTCWVSLECWLHAGDEEIYHKATGRQFSKTLWRKYRNRRTQCLFSNLTIEFVRKPGGRWSVAWIWTLRRTLGRGLRALFIYFTIGLLIFLSWHMYLRTAGARCTSRIPRFTSSLWGPRHGTWIALNSIGFHTTGSCWILLDWFLVKSHGRLESDIVTSWLDEIKLGSSYVRTRWCWFCVLKLQS